MALQAKEVNEDPTHAQLQGVSISAPVLFRHHLKILSHFLPKLRPVSEVHWDHQACACTEETGAIWALPLLTIPLHRGVRKPPGGGH